MKQVDAMEKLHNRGNVIAEKAILLTLKKEITKNDCTLVKKIKGKKPTCIEKADVLKISAIIDVMIENLGVPVKERKDELKERINSIVGTLNHLFN